MEQQTKNRGTWLVIAVWVMVAVLLVAIVVLVVLQLRSGQQADSTQDTQPEHTTAAYEESTAQTETVADAPTEYYPRLDLEQNPYGETDFAYKGNYLTCTAGQSILGVDVSFWQGEINWKLVKAAGMEFAMIRLARRGGDEGILEEDSYARINYEGAKDAGVQVGGYFFSQAITPEEAVEEAEYLLEMVKDWKFEMPIVFDWEQAGGTRTVGMDARTLTDCAKAFCQTIEAGGLEAMLYFNTDMAYYGIYLEELAEYDFWFALYDETLDFPYKVDMWQYTCTGSVPGIYGNVDINLYFPYEEE